MKEENKTVVKESYISPDIKVVEIEDEQNILANGSVQDMPGEDW